MSPHGETHEYICSVEAAINEIGGKWKSLVLCSLKDGTLRFSEINMSIYENSNTTYGNNAEEQ